MYTERALIAMIRRRFRQGGAIVGIGDDAAVLEWPPGSPALFCSDLLVEDTHFRRRTHPPDSLGFKSIAVNVSDIGAMGGRPLYCLLSLALPMNTDETWVDRFLSGVDEACRRFDTCLVGGDTALANRIFIDVSMVGRLGTGKAIGRGGARPGDGIYVSGTLGTSERGRELLENSGPDHPSVRRHLYPEPRHAVGQALAERATAMIDVSDGLSTDLGHILESSGVSAEIDAESIPRDEGVSLELALHGGEDYELIVTGHDLPETVDGVPLTRVGTVIASDATPRLWLLRASGREAVDAGGWKHF